MKNLKSDDRMEYEVVNTVWDAIVVGTGMGGSSVGYTLARAGCRVLFLEKGRSHLEGQGVYDAYPETTFPQPGAPTARHRHQLAIAGRWSEEVIDASGDGTSSFIPFMGAGTGGSSALYGMALERFYPCDFKPRSSFSATGISTVPETWPIGYETLRPYYEQAEKLFGVAGTLDPLRLESDGPALHLPSALNPANAELFNLLKARGMHPYRLPMGCDYRLGTDQSQSVLDASGAKRDAARVCLEPAIAEHGACLLAECEVSRLKATKTLVKSLICTRRGRTLHLQGRTIILAAGALQTPRLLLQSSSRHWPLGLANGSGLVGRNLMRHLLDLYILEPRCGGVNSGDLKQLAFNDFYQTNGMKLGTVQSFGMLPPAGMMVDDLEWKFQQQMPRVARALIKPLRPFLHRVLAGKRERGLVLASILEDLPYYENAVGVSRQTDELGRRRLQIRYRPHVEDLRRAKVFKALIKKTLRPYRLTHVSIAKDNRHLAHACGTCRFGEDPVESVLNSENRAHGIENLFVVDASFFPSSGGTNPGLTIAANGLRVAGHILDRLGISLPSNETLVTRKYETSQRNVLQNSEGI